MTTLAEIEKAVAALPAGQQEALLRRLSQTEARGPRNGLSVIPPKVPTDEIERIEARIAAEFSQVDPAGW